MNARKLLSFVTILFCTVGLVFAQDEAATGEEMTETMATESVDAPAAEEAPMRMSSRSRARKPLFKSWALSVSPGVLTPLTDVRTKDIYGSITPEYNEIQYGVKAGLTKMLSPAFGIHAQVMYGRLIGAIDTTLMDDQSKREFSNSRSDITNAPLRPQIKFETMVLEPSISLYWNISNTVYGINRYYKKQAGTNVNDERRASLYAYAGVGLSFYDADQTDLDGNSVPSEFGVNTSGDPTSLVFPFALGAKFKVSQTIDIGFETSLHVVMDDKVDGLVTDYRGNNDKYHHTGVTLTYKIGSKDKGDHYEWKNPLEVVLDDFGNLERKVDRLTTDRDKDGVADFFDKDNETPEGTVVDGSGVALDIDYDGVPDMVDIEPFSDKDAIVDDFGKSIDTDGDGVPDTRDLEPNTKQGRVVNFQGVDVREALMIKGKPGAMGRIGAQLPSVYFASGAYKITRESEFRLFEAARIMKKNENLKFNIVGNCDEVGTNEFNIELGEKRAKSVANYLIETYGIDASRIETKTNGEEERTSAGRQVNRRVDILIAE